jgi:hypothetical protein
VALGTTISVNVLLAKQPYRVQSSSLIPSSGSFQSEKAVSAPLEKAIVSKYSCILWSNFKISDSGRVAMFPQFAQGSISFAGYPFNVPPALNF